MLQRTWILHLSSSCCLFMNIFALKRNHTSRLVAWCAYACSTSMLKTWGTSQMGTLTIFDSFIICWKSIPQLGCMWFVKTEIIFTDKTCWSKIKITISKEEMKDITNFEYLGFIIANNRHCSQQARKRWTVAMQSVNSIKKNGLTAARFKWKCCKHTSVQWLHADISHGTQCNHWRRKSESLSLSVAETPLE